MNNKQNIDFENSSIVRECEIALDSFFMYGNVTDFDQALFWLNQNNKLWLEVHQILLLLNTKADIYSEKLNYFYDFTNDLMFMLEKGGKYYSEKYDFTLVWTEIPDEDKVRF